MLRMHFRTLTTWAAVPLFSLAGVFVLGELTTLIHAPFAVPAFIAFTAALALGVLLRRRLPTPTGRRQGGILPGAHPWDWEGTVEIGRQVLLVLLVVFALPMAAGLWVLRR